MIGQFGGRVIDTAGDGILAEFPSVVNAVECAIAIQRKMLGRNVAVAANRRMQFRMGINLGDVIYDGDRIFGDGINIAARLEAIAEAGGICISGKVHEEIRGKIDFACDDLGECELKNIANPVRVYGIVLDKNSPRRIPVPATKVFAQKFWSNDVLHYFVVPLVLLLATHHLMVNVFDVNSAYLRATCVVVPFAFGFVFFLLSGRSIRSAICFAVALGVLAVVGMTVSQSLNSGDPIIPQTRYEWWDNVNFAALISISFLVGHTLARAFRVVQRRRFDRL